MHWFCKQFDGIFPINPGPALASTPDKNKDEDKSTMADDRSRGCSWYQVDYWNGFSVLLNYTQPNRWSPSHGTLGTQVSTTVV